MGAISTTLNLNGNMESKLSALAKRAESLYTSLQKVGRLQVAPIANLSSLGANTQNAARSVQGLKTALSGIRGVTAEVTRGLQQFSSAAKGAETSAQSLTASLRGLGTADTAINSLSGSSTRASGAQRQLSNAFNSTGSSASKAAKNVAEFETAAQTAAKHTSALVASLSAAWAVYGSFHAARGLFETSDKMTSIEGRLRIGIDESSMREAKAYLQQNLDKIPVGMDIDTASSEMAIKTYKDKLMSIANETRQQFTEVADFATKLMVNVGGKAFKSTNELLDFTKTLNKFLVVSGSTGSEASSVYTQLPQALSAGALQGDELRSLRENAPLVKNVIQDYANQVLGLQGDIKDLGAAGKITARTVVDAVKWGANEAESKLGKMPWTWSQRWNMFSNTMTTVMENVYAKMQALANMRGADGMFSDLAKVAAHFAGKLVEVVGALMAFGTALSNEGLLYPTLVAGITVLTVAITTLVANKVIEITVGTISLLWKAKDIAATSALSAAQATHAGIVGLLTGSIISNTWAAIGNALATAEQTIATVAHNAAMAVYGAIMAGATVITTGGTLAMIAHAAATAFTTAATWGLTIAKGALLIAAALLLGVIIALAPVIIVVGVAMFALGTALGMTTLATWGLNLAIIGVVGVVILLVGAVIMFIARMLGAAQMSRSIIYYIGALFGWLYAMVYNVVAHIWNVIANFANFFANVLDDPCQAWVNLIHAMVDDCLSFLQSLASAIDGLFGSNLAGAVAGWKGAVSSALSSVIGSAKPMKQVVGLMEYKDVGATASAAGTRLEDFMGSVKEKIGSYMNMGGNASGFGGGYDKYNSMPAGGAGGAGAPDGTGRAIKDNTGRTADAVESVAENLDWLITANERRAINSFTNNSYEVPVNVTINGGDRNLAGIAEEIRWNLTDYLTERLNNGAEGAMQGV